MFPLDPAGFSRAQRHMLCSIGALPLCRPTDSLVAPPMSVSLMAKRPSKRLDWIMPSVCCQFYYAEMRRDRYCPQSNRAGLRRASHIEG